MVAVVLSTYNPPGGYRSDYCVRTVRSLLDNLKCSGPCLFRLVLADDGSEDLTCKSHNLNDVENYLQYCAEMAENRWGTPSTIVRTPREGIGASLNNALKEVDFAEHWMYSTDDWVLEKELDIQPALGLMREFDYDYVRLNPLHPSLMCKTMFNQNQGWWLHLFQQDGGFAFGTRPFVATKPFVEKVGPFISFANAYDTERDYAQRVARKNDLRLAAMVDLSGSWLHIGEQQVGKIVPTRAEITASLLRG